MVPLADALSNEGDVITSFPAKVPTNPDPPKNIVLCTVGLDNFVSHPDSDMTTTLRAHLDAYYRGNYHDFHVGENEYLIKEALKWSRPRLFRGRRIVLVDCRSLDDLRATEHIGWHPEILEASVANAHFPRSLPNLAA